MDIQVPQIIFQIINFSVVLTVLSFFLYKPILKILEQRKQKIADAEKKAQLIETAEQDLQRKEEELKKKAEQQAANIIEKARQEATKQKQQIITEAKETADTEIDKKKQNWKKEKKQQLDQMQKEFNQAVIAVTEKVVGKMFDKKTHTKLINQEVEQLLKSIKKT